MTIHYKQSDVTDGFNASYVVLVCPDHCPANRTCVNGQCVCPEGWSGSHCAEPLCPNNCSAELKRGICDKVINYFISYSCLVLPPLLKTFDSYNACLCFTELLAVSL